MKNSPFLLILLFSIPLFSQKSVGNKGINNIEKNVTYLDSIKKTFINDEMAFCVDSLWMNELTNLDLYNDISNDVENIDLEQKVDYELSTDLLKSRLKAMNAKSPFRIEYNEILENVIKSFLKYRSKSYERLMAISEYYFPMFEEAFAKKNVPLEIKYLAIVESSLNPKAVSRVGATGLWQFMYQTGKQYKLNVDSYIDERSDPLKSTAAAARYMSNMYSIFGDWELVLASYNSGPGNVSKAIRRSGGKQNYWNIRENLPKETQGYVPAFLATMYIYEYHNEHGIVPNRALVQHFATDTVMIKRQMSFKQISDLLDVPITQLELLNPSYKLNLIPFYNDADHFLRLPKEKIAVFTSNEDKIYAYAQYEADLKEKPYLNNGVVVSREIINSTSQRITRKKTNYYKVRSGDNLGAIAIKFNVSVTDIKKWNRLRSNMIGMGKSLKIVTNESFVKTIKKKHKEVNKPSKIEKQEPVIVENEADTDADLNDKLDKDSTSVSAPIYYVVEKGDTLGEIALKYDVTIDQIKEWNDLSNTVLKLGSSLQVSEKEVTQESNLKDIQYVVQNGDNLESLSKKFGSSLEELKDWNELLDDNLELGSTLIVAKSEVLVNSDKVSVESVKKKEITAVKKKSTEYHVKKGDSLYIIARKYPGVSISDIVKWNNIKNNKIKPGMKLKING